MGLSKEDMENFYEQHIGSTDVTILYRDTEKTVDGKSKWGNVYWLGIIIAWIFQAMDTILKKNPVAYSQGIGNAIVFNDVGIAPVSWRGYRILRHELSHVRASKDHPILWFLGYILPPVLNPFRTLNELHGYTYSMQAQYERDGRVSEKWVDYIVNQLSGPSYVWAWPFKNHLRGLVRTCRNLVLDGKIADGPQDEYLGLWEFYALLRANH